MPIASTTELAALKNKKEAHFDKAIALGPLPKRLWSSREDVERPALPHAVLERSDSQRVRDIAVSRMGRGGVEEGWVRDEGEGCDEGEREDGGDGGAIEARAAARIGRRRESGVFSLEGGIAWRRHPPLRRDGKEEKQPSRGAPRGWGAADQAISATRPADKSAIPCFSGDVAQGASGFNCTNMAEYDTESSRVEFKLAFVQGLFERRGRSRARETACERQQPGITPKWT